MGPSNIESRRAFSVGFLVNSRVSTRQIILKIGCLLLVGLAGGIPARSCVGEQQKTRALELRRLANEIAAYPEAKATGEKVVFKSSIVYFFNYYETADDFTKVKVFYHSQLEAKGWTKTETPPSIFVGAPSWISYRKGDYVITIERDDNRADHFDVVFEWNPE